MIQFNNLNQETPYALFEEKYMSSLKSNQQNIEAICISSYSHAKEEVNSRFVNLKFVNDKEFIFFSNYNSPKANDFFSHSQITALIYWSSIDVQIRMKANVKKTSREFNLDYFSKREKKKNALAISSKQSNEISSYEEVLKNYENTLKRDNLGECPEYWGGYSFIPYYFEFWEGHKSRINKREVYEIKDNKWINYFIQP